MMRCRLAASICESSGDAVFFASWLAVPVWSPSAAGLWASSASIVYDPSDCLTAPAATRSPTTSVGRVNDTAPASMYFASGEIVAVMSVMSTIDSSTETEIVSPSMEVMVPATLILPISPPGSASEPACGPLVDVPRSAQASAGFPTAASVEGVAAAAPAGGGGSGGGPQTKADPRRERA